MIRESICHHGWSSRGAVHRQAQGFPPSPTLCRFLSNETKIGMACSFLDQVAYKRQRSVGTGNKMWGILQVQQVKDWGYWHGFCLSYIDDSTSVWLFSVSIHMGGAGTSWSRPTEKVTSNWTVNVTRITRGFWGIDTQMLRMREMCMLRGSNRLNTPFYLFTLAEITAVVLKSKVRWDKLLPSEVLLSRELVNKAAHNRQTEYMSPAVKEKKRRRAKDQSFGQRLDPTKKLNRIVRLSDIVSMQGDPGLLFCWLLLWLLRLSQHALKKSIPMSLYVQALWFCPRL